MALFPFFSRKSEPETPQAQGRFDGLVDATTGRGGPADYVSRQVAGQRNFSYRESRALYTSAGFVRNIIGSVPQDCVREWFKITGVTPEQEKQINERYQQLDLRDKLVRLLTAKRMSNQGSFMYYGVLADQIQNDLTQPLPPVNEIRKLHFLNVIEDGQSVSIRYANSNDPTLATYGIPEFQVASKGQVNASRMSWLVDSWDMESLRGVSLLEVIIDAIIAQDASFWSVTQILKELSIAIFKSDDANSMDPAKQITFLRKLKIWTDSTSRLLLKTTESYERQFASVGGIKEMTDYVVDVLSGVGRVPRSVVLGKAHGVMTAQEADQLNYYADCARHQENDLLPVITKVTDLIVAEKQGMNQPGLKYGIEFNPLWKLDPKSQAEVDKLNSERDQIDIDAGKLAPTEARKLDPRLKDLPGFAPPAPPGPPV